MIQNTSFDIQIEQMKNMAEILVPQTFPKVGFTQEKDITILKQKTLIVDGYEVLLCFSKSDYNEYTLESLQIQGLFMPFLPFYLVCKIGKMFFKSDNMALIEFFRVNKKVYCWVLKSENGQIVIPDKSAGMVEVENFKYHILDPGSIELF